MVSNFNRNVSLTEICDTSFVFGFRYLQNFDKLLIFLLVSKVTNKFSTFPVEKKGIEFNGFEN